MAQILLRSNRRIASLVLIVGCVTGLLLAWTLGQSKTTGVQIALGFPLALVGWFCWKAAMFLQTPRVILNEQHLVLYLHWSRSATRIPLDAVEVFFIGQGAVTGNEPGHPRDYQGAVAANVIVRLAESKTDWQSGKANNWLAVWADGYITLRGLWCENIDQDVVKQMNTLLLAAKRTLRKRQKTA